MIVWTYHIYFISVVVFHLQIAQAKENNEDGIYMGDELALKTRIAQIRQFLLPMPEVQFQEILKKTVQGYIPIQAVSEECRNHSNHLLESFMRGDMWALKMLDAGSKLVSGVLDGHFQDLGNYEQCINVREPNLDFQGQHCVVKTCGVLPTQQDSIVFYSSDVTFSVCVPSSCSVEDVVTHVDLVLAPLRASTLYSASLAAGIDPSLHPSLLDCSSTESPPFRFKDYMATLVFGLITAAVLACTFFEPRYGTRHSLSAYSLTHNFQVLMDTTPSASEITCLNGLRVVFIAFVLMYNRFFTSLFAIPTLRQKTFLEEFGSSTVVFMETATSCVQAFFMIGGTVLSYSFFRNRRKQQAFNVLHFYIKRYFRLTPVLAVMMLFYSTLYLHLSRGPMWKGNVIEKAEHPCDNYWWAGLLHISNYYVSGSLCVAQSWYVACDFQFHLLAPLLLFPLYKRPRLGWLLLVVCFTVPIVSKFANSYVYKLYPESVYNEYVNVRDTIESEDQDYRGFHYRAPGFVLGIALGYILFMVKHNREHFKLSKPFFLFGWTVITVGLVGSYLLNEMVISPDHEFSPWIDPLFNALARPIFCGCVAWVIFTCSLGYGGFVNQFLSWRGFRPLAKLTYGVYLVHEVVLGAQLYSTQTPLAFSHLHFWCSLCGDMVVSFALSAVLYLLVEKPFLTLALSMLKGKESRENMEKQMQVMSDQKITMSTE